MTDEAVQQMVTDLFAPILAAWLLAFGVVLIVRFFTELSA